MRRFVYVIREITLGGGKVAKAGTVVDGTAWPNLDALIWAGKVRETYPPQAEPTTINDRRARA